MLKRLPKKLDVEKKKRGFVNVKWKTFDSESGQSVTEGVGVGPHFVIWKGRTPEIRAPRRDGGVQAGIGMVLPGGGRIYTSHQVEEEPAGQGKGAVACQGQGQGQFLVPCLDLDHFHQRLHRASVVKIGPKTNVFVVR
jgi:hypothetical protein